MNDTLAAWLIGIAALAFVAPAAADPANPADALRAEYLSLAERLQQSPFGRPLLLESTETPQRLSATIRALVDHPFETLRAGLDSPARWCELISLHSNTKYCRASAGASGGRLEVRIGKKTPEDLAGVPRLEFDYSAAGASAQYMKATLVAQDGPMGTSDYRFSLEAIGLADGRSFLRMRYSYAVGFAGRLAMQAYLATAGRGKVGFTITGRRADGQPEYIGGVRAVVERNTMRYYLALDALLEAQAAPPSARFERRLRSWFAAVERHPLQLHEMEINEYLSMKRAEQAREKSAPAG